MSVPRPVVDASARAALDAIDRPVTVATAIRDRDGRLLDFRLEHVNHAASRWAGLPPTAMIGRLITDLIPGLRPAGLFDALDRVVATGQPFIQRNVHYEGNVEEGRSFDARFDMAAVRLGDGYLSAWTELAEGDAVDLGDTLELARAAVPVIRLEARPTPRLALRPA